MKQISNPGVLCSVMATAAQLATARTTWAHGPDAVSANQEMPSRKAACVTGILWAHGPEISSIRRSVQAQILLGFLPDFHGEFGWTFSKAKHHFNFHMTTKTGTKNVYHSEVGKPTSLSVRNGCSRTSKGPVSLQLGTLPVRSFKFVPKQNMLQASIRHGTGLRSRDRKNTRLVIKWNKLVCGWSQSMDHGTSSFPLCNKFSMDQTKTPTTMSRMVHLNAIPFRQ